MNIPHDALVSDLEIVLLFAHHPTLKRVESAPIGVARAIELDFT